MPDDNAIELEIDPKQSRDYWRRWIKAAKKAAKNHFEDAKSAWEEYEHPAKSEHGSKRDEPRTAGYPIYWSSCKTVEPAYYSRTPDLSVSRRFNANDDYARTASLIVERLGTYLRDNSDFDNVMRSAVADFIHADKATTQVLYEEDVEECMCRMALTVVTNDDGSQSYAQEDGSPYEGEEPQSDEGGFYFEQRTEGRIDKRINLAPVIYDEVLHSPEAKGQTEIKEIAYFFCMSKDEAEERFGKEKTARVNWKLNKGYATEREQHENNDLPGKYLEGWEIYCKDTKTIYWYSDQYSEDLLDTSPDIYKFRGFFPSPAFIIGSKPAKSMYPTPAFIHVSNLVKQLHCISQRVYMGILAARRRALIDGSVPEVQAAFEELGDNEFIVIKNLRAIVEKGGLSNLVQYLPVQEIVSAIAELNALEEKFKNDFYEWFGVPDILRGASDPVETAAAQEIKQASAHDRFKDQKKKIATLARDSLEMMLDLALQVYDDTEIQRIVGFQFMNPEDQQRFPAALQMLRDDEERFIRLEVDSDSLSFLDQQLRYQRVGTATTQVVQGLQMVSQMAQIDPSFAVAGLQTVLASLDTMQAGKMFMDSVKQAGDALLQKLQNPPEQGPPPPDYEQMKLQLEQQKAQMDAQLQAQKQQTDAALKARELQGEEMRIQVEAQKANAETAIAQMKLQLEQVVQQFAMQIESMRVDIEQYKAAGQVNESQLEEQRLARDSEIEAMRVMTEAQKPQAPTTPPIINVQPQAAPTITPVNINLPPTIPGL